MRTKREIDRNPRRNPFINVRSSTLVSYPPLRSGEDVERRVERTKWDGVSHETADPIRPLTLFVGRSPPVHFLLTSFGPDETSEETSERRWERGDQGGYDSG